MRKTAFVLVVPIVAACACAPAASPPGQTTTTVVVAPPASYVPSAQNQTSPPPPKPEEPARPRAEPLQVPPEIEKIVAEADRDPHDRELDAGRHPGELLTFIGIAPGMHVAEIGAGTGYTTELLARAVGPKGKVWAQNSAAILKFVDKPWKERLGRPVMKNVIRVDRDLDSPFPPEAKNLDGVVNVLFYHDTVWLGVDRDKMNKAVFVALKPGAKYVIVDHAAADGHGGADAKTLHRIEEATVIQEVERAGFHRAREAAFLRNPDDARDWNDAPNVAGDRRGKSDRFVLEFVKP